MAFVTNVGTLSSPMTKPNIKTIRCSKTIPIVFASDQVSQFQAGRSDAFSFTGWGGRISDN